MPKKKFQSNKQRRRAYKESMDLDPVSPVAPMMTKKITALRDFLRDKAEAAVR